MDAFFRSIKGIFISIYLFILRVTEKPGSQLYQFLLLLLEDESKKEIIEWVNELERIFRIKDTDKIAKMWGEARPEKRDCSNSRKVMTYSSLSRSLRYYYKEGMMNSVKTQLHYQFTEKAILAWTRMMEK